MLVKKIAVGFVVQTFDTEIGKWTGQEFVAGDVSTWENEDGEPIEEPDNVPGPLMLHMEQPDEEFSIKSVWRVSDIECLEDQPDNDWEFTPEERMQILHTFKHREDANIGLCWRQLETICGEFWDKKCGDA